MAKMLEAIKILAEGTVDFANSPITAIKSIATIVSAVVVIAGAIIAFDGRYAHAADVSQILSNQTAALQAIRSQQKHFQLFQLDYYDQQIKRIEEDQRQIKTKPKKTAIDTVALSALELQRQDLLKRKEFITKNLAE